MIKQLICWLKTGHKNKKPIKVREYKVINNIGKSEQLWFFESKVNEAIRDGYELIGGIAILNGYYFQAVTRQVEVDNHD